MGQEDDYRQVTSNDVDVTYREMQLHIIEENISFNGARLRHEMYIILTTLPTNTERKKQKRKMIGPVVRVPMMWRLL